MMSQYKLRLLYIIGGCIMFAGQMTARQADDRDSLATYIASAIRNNPGLMGEYQNYQAQMANANGAGTLSDPQVNVGIFPQGMRHVNVKQIATVSVMQMFPWFGTLKAGRQQMSYKAEAAYQKYREKSFALALDVEKQWNVILAQKEKIKAVRKKLSLIDNIRKVTVYQYKSYAAGKGSKMSDQLRLDAERVRLEEQVESLEDGLKLQYRQFNLLLHRQPDEALFFPDSIVRNDMPVMDWERMERNNPRLGQLQAEEKSFEAQAVKAKNMGRPMIGVGLQYMWNGKVDMPMMADMNGKDMIMPMVSFTLPIYRKKTSAAKRSAELLKQSAVQGYKRQRDVLKGEWLAIVQRADDVSRKARLYDQEVILLDQTLGLMQKEYVTGATTLTDILQTLREGIDYELKKAEAKAEYNTVVAEAVRLMADDSRLNIMDKE